MRSSFLSTFPVLLNENVMTVVEIFASFRIKLKLQSFMNIEFVKECHQTMSVKLNYHDITNSSFQFAFCISASYVVRIKEMKIFGNSSSP